MVFKSSFLEELKCRERKFYLGCGLVKDLKQLFRVALSQKHFKPKFILQICNTAVLACSIDIHSNRLRLKLHISDFLLRFLIPLYS